MVICLERGADLHMAQLMPLPLAVSCFSKVQIGFTFLVPAHPGSPGQRAVKRVCVCVLFAYLVVGFDRTFVGDLRLSLFAPDYSVSRDSDDDSTTRDSDDDTGTGTGTTDSDGDTGTGTGTTDTDDDTGTGTTDTDDDTDDSSDELPQGVYCAHRRHKVYG